MYCLIILKDQENESDIRVKRKSPIARLLASRLEIYRLVTDRRFPEKANEHHEPINQ